VNVAALSTVQNVLTASLTSYEHNPRVIPPRAVELCAESITAFGWQQPLVADRNHVIIAGHVRLAAARHLGLETVPVIIADQLTPEQVRAYRIADNRTHDYTTWDYGALAAELHDLTEFSDVLDLADWEGIIAGFEAETGTEIHHDSELSGMLSQEHQLTVLFATRDDAERAAPLIGEMPGVVHVRDPVRDTG